MFPMMPSHLFPNQGVRRYQIQESMFSLNENFLIRDEFGREVFFVQSQLFSIGDKLLLSDMNGNALIKIRQEILNFLPTFRLLSAFPMDFERPLGVVRKQFKFFQQQFIIESIYGIYSLESLDIFAHRYHLTKNGRIVATVNKQFFSVADCYGVEIVAEEDHAFVLSIVIVLDQIIFDRNEETFF